MTNKKSTRTISTDPVLMSVFVVPPYFVLRNIDQTHSYSGYLMPINDRKPEGLQRLLVCRERLGQSLSKFRL